MAPTYYENTVEQIRIPPTPTSNDKSPPFEQLIHYATLAPNSHNTQPWKFRVDSSNNVITVLPDLTRSCPVVDPDDHHLYVSLGCAVENMVLAANHYGYEATVDASSPSQGIKVSLGSTPLKNKEASALLFDAIPKRQCTRSNYDGTPLSPDELNSLKRSTTDVPGVHAVFFTDATPKQAITSFVLRANEQQFQNKHFTNEIKQWTRFYDKEALRHGDGMVGRCMGVDSPSIPRWMGNVIFPFVVGPESEKLQGQLDSSAGFVAFVSDKDDPTHWVNVGRCYERFALQATSMNIQNAFINQPVEEMRHEFQKQQADLDSFARVDLLVRFGKTTTDMPKSLRRGLNAVIVVE